MSKQTSLKINIPAGAKAIINTLTTSGYSAYVVGGCVRDSLLGLVPHDWDICTSATPEQVSVCFQGQRIIETGLKHGTVTIMDGRVGYEVTTFRTDSTYSDNRHPDGVRFTLSLEEDLARRDFTVNAMAYNDEAGLIDPFGGQESLERRLISCVGAPADRFCEDALRILRALRFSATYDFDIDAVTSEAIHTLFSRLEYISAERICSELSRLLVGSGVLRVLLEYNDVITNIIPELKPCVGFGQKNRFHQYTMLLYEITGTYRYFFVYFRKQQIFVKVFAECKKDLMFRIDDSMVRYQLVSFNYSFLQSISPLSQCAKSEVHFSEQLSLSII